MKATFDFKKQFITITVVWHNDDYYSIKGDKVILRSTHKADKDTALFLSNKLSDTFNVNVYLENNIEYIELYAYFKDITFNIEKI